MQSVVSQVTQVQQSQDTFADAFNKWIQVWGVCLQSNCMLQLFWALKAVVILWYQWILWKSVHVHDISQVCNLTILTPSSNIVCYGHLCWHQIVYHQVLTTKCCHVVMLTEYSTLTSRIIEYMYIELNQGFFQCPWGPWTWEERK